VFPVRYKLYILPTLCICVCRMVLTINNDCFPKQHSPVGLCSGDGIFPVRYGLDVYMSFSRNSVFKGLIHIFLLTRFVTLLRTNFPAATLTESVSRPRHSQPDTERLPLFRCTTPTLTFPYIRSVYEKALGQREETDLEILTDLFIFSEGFEFITHNQVAHFLNSKLNSS
jgi:hypothetical protein